MSIHGEVSRLIEFKRLLRASALITIAEVQGDAFGFGFGLAILCDLTLVSSSANRHAAAPARDADEVRAAFGAELAYILDGAVGGLERPTPIRDVLSGEMLRT